MHNWRYLRSGVQLVDVGAGHFAEVLLNDPTESTHVLIDARPCSQMTRDLALAAWDAGIPMTLITNPSCSWAHGTVTEVFALPIGLNHFRDATFATSLLIGLMINGVFRDLGAAVEARMARVSALPRSFVGHVGLARGPTKHHQKGNHQRRICP